jgi:hypothetical protein
MKIRIIICFIFIIVKFSYAQNIIEGTIFFLGDSKGFPGISISINDSACCSTDINGQFYFDYGINKIKVIEISGVGIARLTIGNKQKNNFIKVDTIVLADPVWYDDNFITIKENGKRDRKEDRKREKRENDEMKKEAEKVYIIFNGNKLYAKNGVVILK